MDGRYLALLSAFFFGLAPVILTLGYRRIASVDLAILVSMVVGLPLLIGITWASGGLHVDVLSPLTLLLFALGGLLGPLLGRGFLYAGIERLGSSRAFTIQHLAPMITAVAAVVILSEPVTGTTWLAILLMIGGMTLTGRQSKAAVPQTLRVSGLVFALLAALSFGMRPVVMKLGFSGTPDPLMASLIGVIAALLGLLVYMLATGRLRRLSFDRKGIILFAIVGVLNNLGSLLVNFAFNAGDVSVVYPINSSAPLLTFAMSYFLLKNVERLAFWDLVGTVAVVSGVILLIV